MLRLRQGVGCRGEGGMTVLRAISVVASFVIGYLVGWVLSGARFEQ
jgi:hypothetical protein